jgi:antitoxin component YwqK of YwqJK toxin-antitoxin module/Tfp pilus assembly protein PilF
MRYAVTLFVFFFLILSESPVLAAEPSDTLTNSDEIIQRANQLNDSGQYESAILLLDKILPIDLNYTWACYELALNYYYSDKPELALAKCREAEFLNYDHPYLFSLMGSILDDIGRPYEGVVILKKAYKKWPYNQNIMYNLGLCYLNAGKPDSASIVLEQVVLFYPYHTRSHLALAKANYAMGRFTESYLASNMAILLSPNSSNILEYENAIGGNSDVTPRYYAYPYPVGTKHQNLDEIRYLLQSELVFSKTFDFPFDMDFTFTRQSYLLFTSLKLIQSDTSVYGRLYAGLFFEIMNKGHFDTFTQYCMNNLGNARAAEWSNKNPGKINNFIAWAQQYLDTKREYGYDNNLEVNKVKINHFTEGTLNSIGKKIGSEEIREGEFIVVSTEGNISEKGSYSNDLAEGEWFIFWPDGKRSQQLNFVHDKLNGIIETFHADGSRLYVYPFTDGLKNGVTKEYTPSGFLSNTNTFINGVLNGPGLYNNFSEVYSREFNYTSDTLNGITKEKWIDGPAKLEYHLKNGLYDGEYKSWYHNGKLQSLYSYTNDIRTGPWASYHYNGMLSDSGMYNESGKISGELRSYDESGRLTLLEKSYNNGLLNGTSISYYENGQERVKQTYENDTIKLIECFDNSGNLLYKTPGVNGSIYFKSFYEDGILKIEGLLNNGKREGIWRNYNTLGILESAYHYSDALLEGWQQTFYGNGQVKEKYACDSGYISGVYKAYFENGHIQSHGFYSREGKEGTWTTNYENDTIQSLTFYSKGQPRGMDITFNPDGTKAFEHFYDESSEPIRTFWYNSRQEIGEDWKYEEGTHVFKTYFTNGKIKSVARISDNVRHGIQEQYYPNGQLSYKLNYLHGKAHGDMKQYDYKGNLMADYQYVYGNIEGKYEVFHEGKPDYAAEYANGNKTCTAIDYYEHNGKPYRVMSIVNNERHGITDYFAPDGNLMYRLRFANNCMKGISWKKTDGSFTTESKIDSSTTLITAYYPNGKVSASISMHKGLYTGKMRTYYSGGSLLNESEYTDDCITGVRKEYYPDGKLRAFTTYANDCLNGLQTLYHPNGIKALEGYNLNDSRHGAWHCYDEQGKMIQILHYEYDEIVDIENK